MSTRDKLLARTKRRYTSETLPGGDQIRLQNLTGQEMRDFRQSLLDRKGELKRDRGDRVQELLISRCVVEEDNTPSLTDADAMNGCFDNMDGAVIAQLYAACTRWTGFNNDDDFAAIEDAVKNSEPTGENSSSEE